MSAENNINTIDTLLFPKNEPFNFEHLQSLMSNGIKHNIPLNWSGQLTKNITWTLGANLTDRSYFQTIKKGWVTKTNVDNSTTTSTFKTDTVPGFRNEYDYNVSSSFSTKLYGMYAFKRGKIIAIRHVFTPTLSFVYTPNFGSAQYGYYRYLTDNIHPKPIPYYSIFDEGIYGTAPVAKSGSINYALANNLEMKVRSKKDTITGTKKIILIDNFTISGGYDVAKDSLNWSKVNMSGRTKLFKNLDITYASLWDPYIVDDSTKVNINKTELKVNKRLFRLSNTDWRLSLNWNLHSKTKKKEIASAKASQEELDMIKANPDAYVDFDQPWNITLSYSFDYPINRDIPIPRIPPPPSTAKATKVIQTLNFNGDINITPKWKVGFTSGYDFIQKELSYTSVNIYRDLHCWEIAFNWIPMGLRKSYNLSIHVKSPVLQDLKLTKKKDYRDY